MAHDDLARPQLHSDQGIAKVNSSGLPGELIEVEWAGRAIAGMDGRERSG